MRQQVRPQSLAIATCPRCGSWWHVGQSPQWVKRGEAA